MPFSQASLLRTTPLSGVATGEGWDHRQCTLVHLRPNLQSVGDCGRSGTAYRGCALAVVDVARAVGAGTAGVGVRATGGAAEGGGWERGLDGVAAGSEFALVSAGLDDEVPA